MTVTTLILIATGWLLVGLVVGLVVGKVIAGGDRFDEKAERLVRMRAQADQRSGVEILGWDPDRP